MGLFGNAPYDVEVDKATSEKNTTEMWDVIIDICDKVTENPKSAKDCLKSIMRRLGNEDPHVVLQAITLLDACVNNCGIQFHLEIASREFETEFRKLLAKSQPAVALKMKLCLKKWAESVFKTKPELNLIPSLYQKLKAEGQDFTAVSTQPIKTQPPLSKDPNVVSSQQEEDDIAKAIELSLRDKGGSPKTARTYSSSIYPTMSLNDSASGLSGTMATANTTTLSRPLSEQRKVRALYDFEAAEDNELTFLAGEIIHVIDDTDPNWWKGCNHRGEGLFPSNFVSADLSVEPESLQPQDNKNKKSVQFNDDEQKKDVENEVIEINEEKIDRLLHLLHEANPEDPTQDSYEMLQLEAQVNQMLPLIDMELERVDRRHAHLTQLSKDLVEANNLYHSLMREPDRPIIGGGIGGYIQFPTSGHLPSQSIYGQSGGPLSTIISTPILYQMPQNIGPTSLPPSMPLSMMGGQQQPMPIMMRNFPTMNQQFPPNSMIPQHLQNGHQSISNSVAQSQQQHHSIQSQHPSQPPPQQQQGPPLGIQMIQPPTSTVPQSNMPNSTIQQQSNPQQQSQLPSINPLGNHIGNLNQSGHGYSMVQHQPTNFQNMPITGPSPGTHLNMNIPQQNQSQPPQQQQQQQSMQFSHPQQGHGPPSSSSQQPQQLIGGGHTMPLMNNVTPHQNMIPSNLFSQQSVTTTNSFPLTDNRTNIPIYQQQR